MIISGAKTPCTPTCQGCLWMWLLLLPAVPLAVPSRILALADWRRQSYALMQSSPVHSCPLLWSTGINNLKNLAKSKQSAWTTPRYCRRYCWKEKESHSQTTPTRGCTGLLCPSALISLSLMEVFVGPFADFDWQWLPDQPTRKDSGDSALAGCSSILRYTTSGEVPIFSDIEINH